MSGGFHHYHPPATGGTAVVDMASLLTAGQNNLNQTPAGNAVVWAGYESAVNTAVFGVPTASEIPLLVAGRYLVAVNLYHTSTVSRPNIGLWLQISTGGPWIDVPGESANAYIRDSEGHNESSNAYPERLVIATGPMLSLIHI